LYVGDVSVRTVSSGVSSYRFRELKHSDVYTFRVCAVNEIGSGPAAVAVKMIQLPLNAPEAIEHLYVGDTMRNSIEIKWGLLGSNNLQPGMA